MNYPVFIPYLFARACISLSSTMLSVAIGWHLYRLTGDPFDLALVGLVQIAPILALFFLTGWVVDNFPRKLVLAICAVSETAVLLGLALAMGQEQLAPDDRVVVFSLLFFHGCSRAFYGPALQATLPNIVSREALSQAVAVTTTVWNTASTAGPFIAGLLLAWLDLNTYWILALLSLIGAVLFFRLPRLGHIKPVEKGWRQVLSGIHFIRNSPYVLGSITLDMLVVLLGSVMALLPVYALDILKVGPEALGLLRAMPALGAVMVGLVMAKLPALRHAGIILFSSLAVFSASILLFAYSTELWLSLLALWLYGGSDMVSVNIRSTLIQLATPDSLRGRVGAVNSIFIATSNQMGDFRAGSVAAVLPPAAAVALGGVMALLVTAAGAFVFPKVRQLDRVTDADIEQAAAHPDGESTGKPLS